MKPMTRMAAILAIAGATIVPLPARAGPPLLCFPYQIGDAKSLPWGNGAFEKKSGYDRGRAVADTFEVLKTADSVLVRMETLRRATVYLDHDPVQAKELLSRLAYMALDAEASGKPAGASRAWFDAGFLVATYRQAGIDIGWRAGVADGIDGLAWIRKGLELDDSDAAMHFGAALVLFENRNDECKAHLARAAAGAEPGSPLARSIESNLAFGGKKVEELRAGSGGPHDGGSTRR